MNAAPLAEEDARRGDDEGSAVAVLVVALALARDALTASYRTTLIRCALASTPSTSSSTT
ncbi:hypothetical protein ACMHYB_15090 [Sorangium sp. So ce1128]